MKNRLFRKVRSVYSYLENRKVFVIGQRRPAGIQLNSLRKLTLRQKRYFGLGKRLFLNGFRRPVKRSLLLRTFLLKTRLDLVNVGFNLNKKNLLNVKSGKLTSFYLSCKKQLNFRQINYFGTHLDYAGFLIAKNLWFLRNPSTTPGAARLRRRKAFYGHKIRATSVLSKLFGNLRFHELLKIYGLSTKIISGKAWSFIQNMEALLPVVCAKLGYAHSISSSCQSVQQNDLNVNGFLYNRNFQILCPADVLISNLLKADENKSNFLLHSSLYSNVYRKYKKPVLVRRHFNRYSSFKKPFGNKKN